MRYRIGVGERIEEEVDATLDRDSVRVRSHDEDRVRARIDLRVVSWLLSLLAPIGARLEVSVPPTGPNLLPIQRLLDIMSLAGTKKRL